MKNYILAFMSLFLVYEGNAQLYGNEWIDHGKTYYKFGVREQRFYRITYSALLNAGLSTVRAENFQLWRDGMQVPVYTSVPSGPLPTNGFIEFYGTPNTGINETELFSQAAHHTNPERSFFNDSAYYFLTINSTSANLRFSDAPNNVASTTLPADSFYMQTVNPLAGTLYLNGGFARTFGADFIRSSNWDEGEGYCSYHFSYTRTTEFNLTGLKNFPNGTPMKLETAVAGANTVDRKYILKINNSIFDSVQAPFYTLVQRMYNNLAVKTYIINDAINFKFNSNNDLWYEGVTVNALKLTYPRQFFHNSQNPLPIEIPANTSGNHIRIAGLPNGVIPPVLYDFKNLKRYIGVLKPDSSLFEIAPSSNNRSIVIGTQVASHLRSITSLRSIQFKNYLQVENQGDYIIISNSRLRTGSTDQVEAYRAYRASSAGGNYRAIIADIDDIADQFCYGNRKNPLAIRHFIKFAKYQFQQTPKSIFLIGKGSNYYYVYRGGGPTTELLNAVPTWGEPSSDNLLAVENNLIPVPMIPIGRLSAVNANEIKAYLDKVKEFEALQKKTPSLPSDNAWRKKIIHLIGGDDVFLAESILSAFMDSYTGLAEAPLTGADVSQFTKINSETFPDNMNFIEKGISEGTGLVTYFGHSSSSSIDFNLGSPQQFNNQPGKYPIYLANGCRAGSIFEFNGQRLSSREVTISDNFTFAPGKGSIAFISNSDLGVINYQNLLTREWYRAFSSTKYGHTLGEIHQEALRVAFARTGSGDFLNRCNLEQNILHGDPGIVPFPRGKPDFALETSFIETNPATVVTETDSITLKLKYFNLGVAVNDEVLITINRELPDGTSRQLYAVKHKEIYNQDSLVIKIGIKGLFEEGNGYIIARIDPGGEWQETDEDNNVAVLSMPVIPGNIKPVFPYNYGIVNTSMVELKASTTNPISDTLAYKLQIDTSTSFTSPQFIQKDTLSPGGIVQWKPLIAMEIGKVYYWRAILAGQSFDKAPVFSFIYLPGEGDGFNQSHFYQHLESEGSQLMLDSNRQWTYLQKLQNLYASHGIYSSSGTDDVHFSISVNGDRSIRSACIGQSIIFNLFDGKTFDPLENDPAGFMGSAANCGAYRQNNFEFRYFNHSNRKLIMDFMDWIPKGTYVAARLVVDPPYDSLQSKYWKKDTAIYGSGKSLYHSLFNQGFYKLDSLNRTRTFFFVYKKDDSATFKPHQVFSIGTSDRIESSVYPTIPDTTGTISSPWLGPATQWNKIDYKAMVHPDATITPNTKMQLWGRTENGQIALLKEYDALQHSEVLGSISASTYPFIQMRLISKSGYNSYPAQLDYWRIFYDPLADGALSGKDHWVWEKDTLNPTNDTIRMQIAFKNVSNTLLGSTNARVKFMNESNQVFFTRDLPLKILPAGDTAIINFEEPVNMGEGNYKMLVEVNEAANPKEANYFNNRAIIPFVIDGGVLPLKWVQWTATKQTDNVLLNWKIIVDKDIARYYIEHSTPGSKFISIGAQNGHFANTHAQSSSFSHTNPVRGINYYRLRIEYRDGSTSYSSVEKVLFDEINGVKIAPNPFNQYFTLYTLQSFAPWNVRIFDANGKLVKDIKGSGTAKIDMQSFASGSYWLEWKSGTERQIIQLLKQ
jgi:hypothetical protein